MCRCLLVSSRVVGCVYDVHIEGEKSEIEREGRKQLEERTKGMCEKRRRCGKRGATSGRKKKAVTKNERKKSNIRST